MDVGTKPTKENEMQSERNWLVKSSTKILGPYYLDEIVDLLQKKQISIIDEVRRPNVRWSYIRERSEFLDVVKSLRSEQDSAYDNTMTMTATMNSTSNTVTVTRTDSSIPQESSQKEPIKDVDKGKLRDVTGTTSTASAASQASVTPVKTYGSAKDLKLQENIERRQSSFILVIFAVAALVASVLALGVFKKNRDRNAVYDELVANTLKYKSIGLYDKALENYKKALSLREPSIDFQNQMAVVLITQDNQVVAGRRILDVAIQQEGISRPFMLDSFLAIGLSYLLEGDLKLADESFRKASGLEPNNQLINLNIALTEIKQNKMQKALSDLDSVIKVNSVNPLAQIARGVTAIELYKQKKLDPSLLRQVYFDLKEFKNAKSFLRQEAGILMATIAHLLNENSEIPKALTGFFDLPFDESSRFVHNIYLDWRIANWKTLSRYVRELNEAYRESPIVSSVMSIVFLAENQDTEAASLLGELHSQYPNNPYVVLAEAQSLYKMGKFVELGALVKRQDLAKFPLALHFQAEACFRQQDLNCFESSIQTLKTLDPHNLYALYSTARLSFKQGMRGNAIERVKDGLTEDANYLPLIEFRDRLETGGD